MRVLKKNWILICIITVAVFALGAIYTFGIAKPKYKATATLKVEIPLSDDSTLSEISTASSAALRYVDSVSKAVKSKKIVSVVAEKNNVSTGHLLGEISTSFTNTSIFLDIAVTDEDGELAVSLVNDLAVEVAKYSRNSTEVDEKETL